MYLIVGLGNPGQEYEETRHNAGFLALDCLAKRHKISFNLNKCQSLAGRGKVSGKDVLLVKPLTYMNRSGIAVKCFVFEHEIEPDKIIVIYDDIDLPFGKIRIREKGGSGGHRGVDSIIKELGASEFVRIRIGIGRPPAGKVDVVEYVLSPFLPKEKEEFEVTLEEVADAVETILEKGVNAAMSRFNSKR